MHINIYTYTFILYIVHTYIHTQTKRVSKYTNKTRQNWRKNRQFKNNSVTLQYPIFKSIHTHQAGNQWGNRRLEHFYEPPKPNSHLYKTAPNYSRIYFSRVHMEHSTRSIMCQSTKQTSIHYKRLKSCKVFSENNGIKCRSEQQNKIWEIHNMWKLNNNLPRFTKKVS